MDVGYLSLSWLHIAVNLASGVMSSPEIVKASAHA